MTYTVEKLKEIVNSSKKSFLLFGEYIDQNREVLGQEECDIGENLMKVLLTNINFYEEIIKKSVEEGSIDSMYFDFLNDSEKYLKVINDKLQDEYGDIVFK